MGAFTSISFNNGVETIFYGISPQEAVMNYTLGKVQSKVPWVKNSQYGGTFDKIIVPVINVGAQTNFGWFGATVSNLILGL